MRPLADAPCRACGRDEHAECWENDPPPAQEGLDCPCPHPRPRFVVRRAYYQHGGLGWAVWDRQEARFTGGWFADTVRRAAQAVADLANESEGAHP